MLERNASFLIDRPNPYRVLLVAVVATPQITLVAQARLCIDHLVNRRRAAMDASRGSAPAFGFNEFHGRQLIIARLWDAGDDVGRLAFGATFRTFLFLSCHG